MARNRQDQHRSDDTRKGARSLPTIGMGFCYTRYNEGKQGEPTNEVDPKVKLCVLVLHDSETGNVCAVPVDWKKNAGFLTIEPVRFMSWLGYSETILQCDQELRTCHAEASGSNPAV